MASGNPRVEPFAPQRRADRVEPPRTCQRGRRQGSRRDESRPTARVRDRFGVRTVTVKRPATVCVPVSR